MKPEESKSKPTLRSIKSYSAPSTENGTNFAQLLLMRGNNNQLTGDSAVQESPLLKKLMRLNNQPSQSDNQPEDPKQDSNSGFKLVPLRIQSDPEPTQLIRLPINEINSKAKVDSPISSVQSLTPPAPRGKREVLMKKLVKSPTKKQMEEEEDNMDEDFNFQDVKIQFPFGIISPYGRFKKYWDILMILVMVYIGFVVPVRLCFLNLPGYMFAGNYDYYGDSQWWPIDLLIDSILFCDILVNLLGAYENDAGILIFDRKEIAKTYLKHWFWIDMISIFPINGKVFSLPDIDMHMRDFNFDNYKAWRIIRLIKLIRVMKMTFYIDKLFSLFTLDHNKISITKSLMKILLFIHFTSCIWNLQGELEATASWFEIQNTNDEYPILSRYTVSLYFSLTLLMTIGYGNIHPYTIFEKGLVVVWMFVAIVLYSYIISSLTASFAKMNMTKTENEEKDTFFRNWAKIFKVPFSNLNANLKMIDQKTHQSGQRMKVLGTLSKTLATLPKGLNSEIYNYVFREIINKVEFFKKQPKTFIIGMMPLLKQANFDPGDHIYKVGEPSLEVYFIVKGRVISRCTDIKGVDRTQIFVEGSLFGEVDVFMNRTRTANVKAEGNLELWKINKTELINLLSKFPETKEDLLAIVNVRETFRAPTAESKKPKDNIVQNNERYTATDIYSVMDDKMQTKLKKNTTKVHQIENFDSMDFEPDLPTPGKDKNVNKQALRDWEVNLTKNLLLKAKLKSKVNSFEVRAKLEEERLNSEKKNKHFGHGNKLRYSLFNNGGQSSRRYRVSRRNSGSFDSLFVKRAESDDIQRIVKKRLAETLTKDQNWNIDPKEVIDKILGGREKLLKMKTKLVSEQERIFEDLDQMIEDAQGLLLALDAYEDTVNEIIERQDIILE